MRNALLKDRVPAATFVLIRPLAAANLNLGFGAKRSVQGHARKSTGFAVLRPRSPKFRPIQSPVSIPLGVSTEDVFRAMLDFTDFLQTINTELVRKGMTRLEDMLMPANFSSMVGEFIVSNLPRHCPTIAKNTYHNGHPDLLPAGKYPGNAAQHAGSDGIEVKASRYLRGWQGHNAEDVWLMVFVFESGRPADLRAGKGKKTFSVPRSIWRNADKSRLEVRWTKSEKQADNHCDGITIRLRENGKELDLPRTGVSDRSPSLVDRAPQEYGTGV